MVLIALKVQRKYEELKITGTYMHTRTMSAHTHMNTQHT